MEVFHEVRRVPVHNTLLMRSREEASGFPTGDITLGYCSACGFIRNTAYDPSLQHYCGDIEETQAFSATFNAFHQRLAEELIGRHQLRGKTVLEIGCGKGEFLRMLCELGGNRGTGFDPAVVPERNGGGDATFIADFYSSRYFDYQADLFICKMTLEHIRDAAEFTGMVRRAALQRGSPAFFMVPNASHVLRSGAFWDVYYEHCSYFTPGALARMFRAQGWRVTGLWTEYEDQYLAIEAEPCGGLESALEPHAAATEETPREGRAAAGDFARNVDEAIEAWRALARSMRPGGKPWALWGGGSKAVAFVSALGGELGPSYAVDINPYKQGAFLPGSGIPVIGPAALRNQRPEYVVVMNPIYQREVEEELARQGVDTKVLALDAAVPPRKEVV
ncbi:MAG: class I SAM-dependent methyltransferase [Bryobacteraceae bacterium]